MDCNKDEALKAKDVAEKKMQIEDFSGAQKFARKAQQLFPDLDNISHMLTVCEVHCAASVKCNGYNDWYRILQVDPTADESSIRKQYRKLALLLHPDKNKFCGAEVAFKLVGEAHRTLSDRASRSHYESKRVSTRPAFSTPASQNSTQSTSVGVHPEVPSAFKNNGATNGGLLQQQHKPQTFWTMCPVCAIKYLYPASVLNKTLRCQNCLGAFIASDVNTKASQMGKSNQPSNIQSPGMRDQENSDGRPCDLEAGPKIGTVLGSMSKNKPKEFIQVDDDLAKEEERLKFDAMNLKNTNKSKQMPEFPGIPKSKRKRTGKKCSDTESSDSEVIIDNINHKTDVDISAHQTPRRSTRQKQNVTYNEVKSDDEDHSSSKHLDETGVMFSEHGVHRTSSADNIAKRYQKEGGSDVECQKNLPNCRTEEVNCFEDSKLHEQEADSGLYQPNPAFLSYPDPDFSDFQKHRSASLFMPGQIWALYDDVDGMPRFYAQIGDVFPGNFKVQYTWLEHFPLRPYEIGWSDSKLSVACGNFFLGATEFSQDLPMFSHMMPCEKGPTENLFSIHPRKGEIWALYKDRDINPKSDLDSCGSYEYEVVEVLSDHMLDTGVLVAFLTKVKGFVSIFARAVNMDANIVRIQPYQMHRFSHMILAKKVFGKGKDGIPEGSFELDTAALPANFAVVFPSVSFCCNDMRVEDKKSKPSDMHSLNSGVTENPALFSYSSLKLTEEIPRTNHPKDWCCPLVNSIYENDIQGKAQGSGAMVGKTAYAGTNLQKKERTVDSSSVPVITYQDPEFYDFGADKSFDKFHHGQIWALYCDVDGLPNYYAIITKVETGTSRVHVCWLDSHPLFEEEVKWSKKGLPLGCGRFKRLVGKQHCQTYDTLEAFSHPVEFKPADRKHQYLIYPCVGEVWALYKNWSIQWEESDRDSCTYDMVEVTSISDCAITVLILEKVKGFYSVFKPKRTDTDMVVPSSEWIRFSNRAPAFRLTEERGGKLRDCCELDPASVPDILLCD